MAKVVMAVPKKSSIFDILPTHYVGIERLDSASFDLMILWRRSLNIYFSVICIRKL